MLKTYAIMIGPQHVEARGTTPREAVRTLYPHASLYGVNTKDQTTTWQTTSGEKFALVVCREVNLNPNPNV